MQDLVELPALYNRPQNLEGKVILISNAATPIGQHLANICASHGATLVLGGSEDTINLVEERAGALSLYVLPTKKLLPPGKRIITVSYEDYTSEEVDRFLNNATRVDALVHEIPSEFEMLSTRTTPAGKLMYAFERLMLPVYLLFNGASKRILKNEAPYPPGQTILVTSRFLGLGDEVRSISTAIPAYTSQIMERYGPAIPFHHVTDNYFTTPALIAEHIGRLLVAAPSAHQ